MNYDDDDKGGIIADLCAKLDLHISSVSRLSDRLERSMKRKPPMQPTITRSRGSATANASGLAVIQFDLDSPTQGHFWYVRSIKVGGLTPITTAAGRADVFVTGGYVPVALAGNLTGLGLSDWQDFSASLPNVAFYGNGEMPLVTNEHIFIVISSGTSGQEYVANLTIFDYEMAADKQEWSL